MEQGKICVYSGRGHGKSSAALGRALQAACQGKRSVIIQFMKGRGEKESLFMKRLEPEIKFFCFEKSSGDFNSLSALHQEEEIQNIRNGLNYAKKVLHTGECDLLVLDEVLALLDNGIMTMAELQEILDAKAMDTTIIMTGIESGEAVCAVTDEVYQIDALKC